MKFLFPLFLLSSLVYGELPTAALVLDLDAAKGLTVVDGDKVSAWKSQVNGVAALEFIHRDEGRKIAGSGRPSLRLSVPALNGKPSLVFHRQELVCMDEDFFDVLTTGHGHTWIAVMAVHRQQDGLKDVNSFFGNLRNGGKFEGVWGCVNDDNTLWWGARNGRTFGRFDQNNPQLLGPTLTIDRFAIVAGRMAAGQGSVKLELFVDSAKPIVTGVFPVNPDANPSRMAIGQERDAIEHPGHESFDGEIARFLIWDRPLTDQELPQAMSSLQKKYLAP
jgi:hypothetical protein